MMSAEVRNQAFIRGAFLLLVVAIAATVLMVPPTQHRAFSLAGALVGAVLIAVAELVPMNLPTASRVLPFTLAVDVFLLVLYGPYVAVCAYLLGFIAAAVARHRTPYDVVHHVTENVPPILAGGLVLWALAPPGVTHDTRWYLVCGVLAALVRVGADLGLAIVHAWVDGHASRSPLRTVLGGYAYVPLLVLAPLGLLAASSLMTEPGLLVLLAGPFLAQSISIRRHETAVEQARKTEQENLGLQSELQEQTIELNRAISQLQRRLSQSFALQAVGAAITQELDLERVLQIISRQSARIAGGDGAFITLLSDDGTHQLLRAAYGPLTPYVGRQLPMRGRLTGEVIDSGRPQISNVALDDPRVDPEIAQTVRITAVVEAPLKVKDRILGVLGVVAQNGKHFDEEDMRLLTVLANQAAIAIDNARLHEHQTELAVFQERNRLARELHDSVTQSLFSIGLYLQASIQRIPDDPDGALELLAKTQDIAQDAQAEMRSLIFELRPAAIRDKGLDFAMENHISLVQRRHDIEVELIRNGDGRRRTRALPGHPGGTEQRDEARKCLAGQH